MGSVAVGGSVCRLVDTSYEGLVSVALMGAEPFVSVTLIGAGFLVSVTRIGAVTSVAVFLFRWFSICLSTEKLKWLDQTPRNKNKYSKRFFSALPLQITDWSSTTVTQFVAFLQSTFAHNLDFQEIKSMQALHFFIASSHLACLFEC